MNSKMGLLSWCSHQRDLGVFQWVRVLWPLVLLVDLGVGLVQVVDFLVEVWGPVRS